MSQFGIEQSREGEQRGGFRFLQRTEREIGGDCRCGGWIGVAVAVVACSGRASCHL